MHAASALVVLACPYMSASQVLAIGIYSRRVIDGIERYLGMLDTGRQRRVPIENVLT